MTASPRVGLCTDSSSLLPAELAERYGVEVVPVTVRIDGDEYLEGVDLDADRFYDLLAIDPTATTAPGAARPAVAVTPPSSGQYALAYDELLSRGCTEIVSVHADASVSGSMNAARLAAHQMGVPVRLVDSGATGFGVSCAVWAAADAAAEGASVEAVIAAAERTRSAVGVVSAVGLLEFLAHGRPDAGCAIPVLGQHDGSMQLVGRAADVDAAVAAMVDYTLARAGGLRVGVGVAHRAVLPVSAALVDAVAGVDGVVDVVGFRLGASAGAAGSASVAGTVSCVMFPTAT